MPRTASTPALLQAVFRDLHGPRLHGFALLVAAGDRAAARDAASRSLADGAHHAAELRHPDRAAAWLRARVLRTLIGRRLRTDDPAARAARREALREVGAADFVTDALAALPIRHRAVLVATAIEHLEPLDVEQIVGRGGRATRRLLREARERYLALAVDGMDRTGVPAAEGPLARRIQAHARRAMGQPAGDSETDADQEQQEVAS